MANWMKRLLGKTAAEPVVVLYMQDLQDARPDHCITILGVYHRGIDRERLVLETKKDIIRESWTDETGQEMPEAKAEYTHGLDLSKDEDWLKMWDSESYYIGTQLCPFGELPRGLEN